MPASSPVSVVVLTHNRVDELLGTLERLSRLPESPKLIVVDNASADGTSAEVSRRFPQVRLVRRPTNEGAAGRNAGVACVETPYAAFCDDDTWWAPGALARGAELLAAHPRVAVLSARVLVGAGERLDATCARMAESPLRSPGLPGPALAGFMAGACVMRVQAFREAGGYEPRLLIGAEETLLSLDLLTLGWHIAYAPELVCHHHPSAARDTPRRQWLLARNRLWIAWMRLPARAAWRESRAAVREAADADAAWQALVAAVAGLPWALRRRRVVPPAVSAAWSQVQLARGSSPAAPRNTACQQRDAGGRGPGRSR
jgi:GT2 family glycosyltransferase